LAFFFFFFPKRLFPFLPLVCFLFLLVSWIIGFSPFLCRPPQDVSWLSCFDNTYHIAGVAFFSFSVFTFLCSLSSLPMTIPIESLLFFLLSPSSVHFKTPPPTINLQTRLSLHQKLVRPCFLPLSLFGKRPWRPSFEASSPLPC